MNIVGKTAFSMLKMGPRSIKYNVGSAGGENKGDMRIYGETGL